MLPSDLDEADAAYVSSFSSIPDDALVHGIIVMIPYTDSETGLVHVKSYNTLPNQVEALGFLTIAKREILDSMVSDAEAD